MSSIEIVNRNFPESSSNCHRGCYYGEKILEVRKFMMTDLGKFKIEPLVGFDVVVNGEVGVTVDMANNMKSV